MTDPYFRNHNPLLKIALGTAQFGMPYGFTNKLGQVSRVEAKKIIELGMANGVSMLDTAISYGVSESCLGNIEASREFDIVTKLPPVPDNISDVTIWARVEILNSLERLKMTKVYGLLLHRPEDLNGRHGSALAKVLSDLKSDGLVEKIGASIYSAKELNSIFKKVPLDIVQAPFNVLDRRLESSGWLSKLKDMDIEVHVRSIFLQGLLLVDSADLPSKFKPWANVLGLWHDWLEENSTSAIEACLQFPFMFDEIDRIVIGVDSIGQFQEIIKVVSASEFKPLPNLSCNDERLINPSYWQNLEN